MNRLAYYAALPDSMAGAELNAEIVELLIELETQKIGGAEFAKCSLGLSDRQWRTYSLRFVHQWAGIALFMSIWNGHDQGMVEDVIAIIARIGFGGIYNFLISCSPENVSVEVFDEIKHALSELGCSVSDPYSGIR
jgi:hypothetical protein